MATSVTLTLQMQDDMETPDSRVEYFVTREQAIIGLLQLVGVIGSVDPTSHEYRITALEAAGDSRHIQQTISSTGVKTVSWTRAMGGADYGVWAFVITSEGRIVPARPLIPSGTDSRTTTSVQVEVYATGILYCFIQRPSTI